MIAYAQTSSARPGRTADGSQCRLFVLEDAAVGATLQEEYQARCKGLRLDAAAGNLIRLNVPRSVHNSSAMPLHLRSLVHPKHTGTATEAP